MQAIYKQLNKAFFWDIDPLKMDADQSKRLIIERVINFGSLHEINLVITYYGEREFKSIICNLSYIDPKTLNFFSLYLDIPKKKFKCYIRKQLISQHWSF